MDEIFQEVSGFKGAFTVVHVAKKKPQRFGKRGELLIDYESTDIFRRRSSVASLRASQALNKPDVVHDEKGEV